MRAAFSSLCAAVVASSSQSFVGSVLIKIDRSGLINVGKSLSSRNCRGNRMAAKKKNKKQSASLWKTYREQFARYCRSLLRGPRYPFIGRQRILCGRWCRWINVNYRSRNLTLIKTARSSPRPWEKRIIRDCWKFITSRRRYIVFCIFSRDKIKKYSIFWISKSIGLLRYRATRESICCWRIYFFFFF